MGKGLIINEDVWTLLEDYEPQEALELLKCLAAFHRGEEVPPISRYVRAAYQRIVLDNGRFDPVRRAELSAKRSEIGKKGAEQRWQNMANDSKTKQTIANDSKNSKPQQEEKRIEEIRIDKNIKEKEIEREKPSGFAKPTVEEIRAYAQEKGYNTFDSEYFWNFYESKNWMVGKNKMANWRSAVSGWALRDKQKLAESAKPTTDYKAQLSKLDYGALLRK